MRNYSNNLLYTVMVSLCLLLGLGFAYGAIQEMMGFRGPNSIPVQLNLHPGASLLIAIMLFATAYGLYRQNGEKQDKE